MIKRAASFLTSEDGVTSIEYALIAFIMTMAILVTLPALAEKISNVYAKIAEAF